MDRPPTPIDWDRFRNVCDKTLDDLKDVFVSAQVLDNKALDTTYLQFLTFSPGVQVPFAGAHRAKQLVKALCGKLGFEVDFIPLNRRFWNFPAGHVSWLVISFQPAQMSILYVPDEVRNHAAKRTLEEDKILSRIFLHEAGHASLHLEEFKKRSGNGVACPGLDPEHEREAWLYAYVVRGVLVGCLSYDRRYYNDADPAWELS